MQNAARASIVGNRPYNPYQGQRVASYDPGFDRGVTTANNAGATGEALDVASIGALQGLGGNTPMNANVQPLDFNQAQVDKYMNPYLDTVLSRQLDYANEQYGRQRSTQNLAAGAQGAYGDYGARVTDAIGYDTFNRQVGDTIAQGLNSGYDRATGMFENARGAQLDADKYNAGYALDADQQAFDQGIGLANQYGTIADRNFQRGLTLSDVQSEDANRRMQYEQAGLDTKYNDYLEERSWDQNQIDFLTSVYYGQPGSTTRDYQNYYSNPLAQGLGAAASIYGAANAFGAS